MGPMDASSRSRGRAVTWLVALVFIGGLAAGTWLAAPLLERRGSPDATPAGTIDTTGGAEPARPTAEEPRPLPVATPAQTDGGAAMTLGGGEDPLAGRRTAATRAAERVGPAVVSITVTRVGLVQNRARDPFDAFFGQYFRSFSYGEVPSLGSGVIADRRGIVVTNEHVIRQAREIKVSLPDGRTFDAEVVSADRTYDLAVLRIQGNKQDLPEAPIGNSDDVAVGEWAIALGNPFGFYLNEYQPTVTAGVISATHRDIKQDSEVGGGIYKDMIQTDAAINPGNSGGPLVNALGEVIGINTFILSPAGGSVGIGFAIPVNTVIRLVREILEYGRVRQVWTGLSVQEISGWVARYYGITDRRGLLVSGIDEGSPAARAGIRLEDIIRAVNDEPVSTVEEGLRMIYGAQVGDRLKLTIERGGRRWTVSLDLIEQPGR